MMRKVFWSPLLLSDWKRVLVHKLSHSLLEDVDHLSQDEHVSVIQVLDNELLSQCRRLI